MSVIIPEKIYRVYCLILFTEHILGEKNANCIFRKTKLSYEKKLQQINENNQSKIFDVDQGEINLTSFQDHYLNSNKPFLFKSVAESWPCCKNWTPEFFTETYPNYNIKLYQARKGLARYNKPDETIKLSHFIKAIKAGDQRYMNFSPLLTKYPELQRDLNHDWLHRMRSDNKIKAEYTLFIGGKGSMTPVHCEPTGNFFIQVYGRKKWTLYPADSWPILKPPASRKFYFYSGINPANIDLTKFPLGMKLDKFEFILEPGDILWNPPFMWHQVENIGLSIGVSYKIDNFLRSIKASPFLMALSLMATNPNVFTLYLKTLLKRDHVFFPD